MRDYRPSFRTIGSKGESVEWPRHHGAVGHVLILVKHDKVEITQGAEETFGDSGEGRSMDGRPALLVNLSTFGNRAIRTRMLFLTF